MSGCQSGWLLGLGCCELVVGGGGGGPEGSMLGGGWLGGVVVGMVWGGTWGAGRWRGEGGCGGAVATYGVCGLWVGVVSMGGVGGEAAGGA